eukprot:CAMPEP_0180020274 /NCGR_PEP_ID=MMETSP0984-20121128/21633_1 /TAXON_ID=483367 /ORGANISM="non described non described, Strain CCMP 2436" /LENGTH=148 /DNA_ID=CAMNT_0021944025 /DNA_START=63 /DNA_END=507 /DNA_ORIENTATION=+
MIWAFLISREIRSAKFRRTLPVRLVSADDKLSRAHRGDDDEDDDEDDVGVKFACVSERPRGQSLNPTPQSLVAFVALAGAGGSGRWRARRATQLAQRDADDHHVGSAHRSSSRQEGERWRWSGEPSEWSLPASREPWSAPGQPLATGG